MTRPIRGLAVCIFLLWAFGASAQTASLTGRVLDQSGAVVPGAHVILIGPNGQREATAGRDGAYSIRNLAAGPVSVSASAPQLTTAQPIAITLAAGNNTLDIEMRVAIETQKVVVESNEGPRVSVDPASNAGALVLSGHDLDALSDDPEDLATDLQALAGPSAGPGGNAIFVDGFSGGQLPPKESIREIRVNSNPFSPEYDKLGYGRIEIFTKPGSDKFHGSVGYNLGTSWWNSRNPYGAAKAPFLLQETENSFSGPLTKHSSFTLDFERQAVDNGSITNVVTLNSALQPQPASTILSTPQRHWLVGPHVDYQLNENNTLSLRYLYTRAAITDAGIGSFDLISRGYHQLMTFNTAQAIETSVHGNTVNETRFQYFRPTLATNANNTGPEIQVLGSFNGGGASTPQGNDVQHNYEFQNYTSVLHGRHFFRFGIRARGQTEDNYSTTNFNGLFTFAGGLAPELNAANQPVLDPSGAPVMIFISSIEQYRRTLLFGPAARALGAGASQFSITAGNPDVAAHQADIAPFFNDDWRIRPNLTLSLGLRYEWQTNLNDRRDFAPRVAVAWAPGGGKAGRGKTVIRGGFGVFYDRFALANQITADRYNGVVQQQYVVANPTFYPQIPDVSTLGGPASQSIWKIDSNLRAPYLMQTAATVERQLPGNTTVAATYTGSRGLHQLRSEDINAPLPGTYTPGASGTGVYPYPGHGPILLMTSSGRFNENQVIFNVNSKLNPALSIFGYYVWTKAMSDTDGLATFPANPYNYAGEYGPAATDIRHHVLAGGTINLRWNIRLNPLVDLRSGAPFNITSGEDIYATTLFNARPGFALSPSAPGVVQTPYGYLDPNAAPGERIVPRNYGRGPALYAVNLRIGRTWGFGPEKGSGGSGVASRDARSGNGAGLGPPANGRGLFSQATTERRFNLTVAMSIRNLLNHDNPGPIIGNISSPLFGQSNQILGSPNGEGFLETADNRRLELQIRFTY